MFKKCSVLVGLIVLCIILSCSSVFAIDFEKLPAGIDVSIIPNNYSIIQAGETDSGIDYIVAADVTPIQSTVINALKANSYPTLNGSYYYNYSPFMYYTNNTSVPTANDILGTGKIPSFTNVLIIGYDKTQGKIVYKVNYSQPTSYTYPKISFDPRNYFYMVQQQSDSSHKVIKINLSTGAIISTLGGDLRSQNVNLISITKTDKVFFINSTNNIIVFNSSSSWQNAVSTQFPGAYLTKPVLAFCATSDTVFYTLFDDYKLYKTNNNVHTNIATLDVATNYYVKSYTSNGYNLKKGISGIIPGVDDNDVLILGYSNNVYINNSRYNCSSPYPVIDGTTYYYYYNCYLFAGGSYTCYYDYSNSAYKQTELDGIDATPEFINTYVNAVKINDGGQTKLSISSWLNNFMINTIDSQGNLQPVSFKSSTSAGGSSIIGAFGTRLINSWIALSNSTYGKSLNPLMPTYGNVTNNLTGGGSTTTSPSGYALTVIKDCAFKEVIPDDILGATTSPTGSVTFTRKSVTSGSTTLYYTLVTGTLTDSDITASDPTKGMVVNGKLIVFNVVNPPSTSAQTATLQFN